MPQSLSNVVVHIVYSTYNATILKDNVDTRALMIGGAEDHVHLLCLLSRKHAIMDVIQTSKTETSKWMKKQGVGYRDFYWQAGYSVFSVSQSNVEQVKRYIANQEDHHRKMSFQDELREMCRRHKISIDERYAWD